MGEKAKVTLENVGLIVTKLKDVYAELSDLANLVRTRIGVAEKEVDESRKVKADVVVREKVVKQKEGIICDLEELEKRKGVLEEAQSELAKDRKTFEKGCSARNAELDQKKADYEAEVGDFKKRDAALKQGIKDLNEEKKTYKDKILNKLGRETG